MRPLIGIPTQADYRDGTRRPVYCNNRSYIHAIEDAGGVPVLIPMLNDIHLLDSLLARLDGLLLTGGVDIQTRLYGETPRTKVDVPDERLDELEMMLANWALQEDMPVLGICRGMQMMNVALGGTLYQDIQEDHPGSMTHCRRDMPRDFLAHPIYISGGSLAEKALGTRKYLANSLHHQAVKTPGKGVVISGRAEDGVAEVLEVPDLRFALAVQYHPEEIYKKEATSARLLRAFVRACSHLTEDEEVESESLLAVGGQ
ncbi:MAG TPA: gamma-glutamyl-gamma-aminobutyrate hydrolase family protein [Ktedonobacteraceae bacterium]|nr:gamma-glutamyl-gamma-aminobutyrate hydrolase family protein [Ktedonobacteraceae bacterium]